MTQWVRWKQSLASRLTLFLIPALTLLLLFPYASRHGRSDPDRYFNLALAREVAERGLVSTLPQFPLLGWNKGFPEKEFFYHQFLGLLYRFKGEEGVLLSVPLLSFLLMALMLWALLRKMAPGPAALFFASTFLLTPIFHFRLYALRSYVLAQILFLGLLLAWEKRRIVLVAALSCLFFLSYNNWGILPLLLLAYALGDWSKDSRRTMLAASAGALLGILVNPHFPLNMEAAWIGVSIALDQHGHLGAAQGVEVRTLPVLETLVKFGLPIALSVFAAFLFWRDKDKRPRVFLACLFSLWIFRNPRLSEYLWPALLLLLPDLFEFMRRRIHGAKIFAGFCILTQLPGLWLAKDLWTLPTPSPLQSVEAVLKEIPSGDRVLHDWDFGALGLYARRDLEFTDVLGPTFLLVEAPELYLLREQLKRGAALDWGPLIREKFGAEWVVASHPGAVAALKQSPSVLLTAKSPPYSLFRVKEK